ncbi:MAG TPA: hypothetical protein VFW65_05375 [Pseudonocardiaceae bacterium]|nr:hypothetical protein [Pseudonocardiaceae bacterium]
MPSEFAERRVGEQGVPSVEHVQVALAVQCGDGIGFAQSLALLEVLGERPPGRSAERIGCCGCEPGQLDLGVARATQPGAQQPQVVAGFRCHRRVHNGAEHPERAA